MNTIIKSLIFDKDLVNTIKTAKPAKEILYNNLISGRITLQEYLAAL